MEEKYEKLLGLSEIDTEKYREPHRLCIKSVSEIFKKYSPEDVAKSIFISNIWLPNIASPVKHQFITAIFATIKPEDFSSENKIENYKDFKEFLKQIYNLLPSFSSLEDFIPEPDWGEIKFHCEGKNYKMFYGNELSNVFDYLILFQMLYEPYKNEYEKHAKRNPIEELLQCLKLQEAIIDGINTQPKKDELDIAQGYLEFPTEDFWKDADEFFTQFIREEIVPVQFLENFCINLGQYPREDLNFKNIGDKIFSGTLIQALFIKFNNKYFPILPRRYSAILFDKWADIFKEYNEKVEKNKKRYALRIGGKLYKYIKSRINIDKNSRFHVVSAVTQEGKIHDLIFTTALFAGNKLILIYLVEPYLSSEDIGQELKNLAPSLKQAEKLIAAQPTTLALHLERQNVQFKSKSGQFSLEPEIFVIIPQVSTQIQSVPIPEDLPGRVMIIDSFIGIIDEIEHIQEFIEFLDYLKKTEKLVQGLFSMLDIFGSFKDSYGTLIGGAIEPDFVMIDPHWGTNLRYKTLLEFWKIYPEIDLFDHPRTWKPKKETDTRIRLEARGYFGSTLYFQLNMTNVFLTAPFYEMEYNQATLSNLLMECLEDSMSRRLSIFENHEFLNSCNKFQINFFPVSMVQKDEKFEHLRHLCKIDKYWCSDITRLDRETYGIRVVFDNEKVREAFADAEDCSLEVEILIEVINQMNQVFYDPNIVSIIELLEKTKQGKPRFKMISVEKPASFPEFINPLEPQPAHFKKAKKRIAEIAKKQNVDEGEYALEEAKNVLNTLRDEVVAEINSEVKKYYFKNSIPFLLARVDALNAEYERHRYMIKQGLQYEIDYQPEVRHAEQHTHFIKTHKNYRYLIEKFVQLNPSGKEKLGKDQFQYLIALIDWLQVFYSASDHLHYGILPVGMKLERDYLVEVVYEKDMEAKEKTFSEKMAKVGLGIIGNPEDRVESPRPVETFMDELNEAFIKDLEISFQKLINVLQIMSLWPIYAKNVQEDTSYSATIGEITDICMENIDGLERDEIKKILEFFTLKQKDVIRVIGQEEPCLDLPVWEYRKRYARYNLRPLIKINDKYHWGPYSARRSGIIWSGIGSNLSTPTDLQSRHIEQVLREEKKLIEDALAEKTHEILKRDTPFAEKNIKLHNLKPKGSRPSELGDYEALSFHPDKNVIFNIECKDILPAYCLKDSKRLREKIFGRPGKDKGYFKQIIRRKKYLEENVIDIVAALEWPVDSKNLPKIITIYVSRYCYWWTQFPSDEIEAEFLRIDFLYDFIKNIK